MKNITIRFVGVLSLSLVLSVGAFAKTNFANSSRDKKITPEELITKHLASIGSPEAVKGLKSIQALGRTTAVFKGRGTGTTQGLIVIASQGNKNMIGMKFQNASYPVEALAYDGKDFSVGLVAGKRTLLGSFLRNNKKTFKYGLMGGALSTSWELFNYDKKRGKLKYRGKKKIDGADVFRFSYSPRKGSDLKVTMFFDAATFRHVRTEYTRVITANIGTTVDNSAQQSETRYKMVEKYDDFRAENGLTLPHVYNLYLEILTGNGSTAYDWKMELQKFEFNKTHDISQFRVGSVG